MTAEIKPILDSVRQIIQETLHGRVEEIYLYGSHARGDARTDSDIDILIIIDHEPSYLALLEEIGPKISALSLQYDVVISPAFVSKQRFDQDDIPFLIHVKREAIAI